MKDLTVKLQDKNDLSEKEVFLAAQWLLDETASVEERVDFLAAFADKGEQCEEIAAFVNAFLEVAVQPELPNDLDFPLIDVCGTGGDKLNLFNVSTTAMFIIAGAGAGIAKHGNRGITSKCGGADVLEELGVKIDIEPQQMAEIIAREGVGFLFAPQYHPAFKAVVPVRQELAEQGKRTVFNILGPLLNPLKPDYQLIGVFDESLPPVFAKILKELKRKNAWAVHGLTADGLPVDEVSTMGKTAVVQSDGGQFSIDPSDLNISAPATSELQGGGAFENAEILLQVLRGEDSGACTDIACLNAAAGLVITGLATELGEGLELARRSVQDGAALQKLEILKQASSSG